MNNKYEDWVFVKNTDYSIIASSTENAGLDGIEKLSIDKLIEAYKSCNEYKSDLANRLFGSIKPLINSRINTFGNETLTVDKKKIDKIIESLTYYTIDLHFGVFFEVMKVYIEYATMFSTDWSLKRETAQLIFSDGYIRGDYSVWSPKCIMAHLSTEEKEEFEKVGPELIYTNTDEYIEELKKKLIFLCKAVDDIVIELLFFGDSMEKLLGIK